MKSLKLFHGLATLVTVASCLDERNLTAVIESLSARLEKLEGKGGKSTAPRGKREVVFRGQPELGLVLVSGVYTMRHELAPHPHGLTHGGAEFLTDNDYSTFWHSDKPTGGDFIKIRVLKFLS